MELAYRILQVTNDIETFHTPNTPLAWIRPIVAVAPPLVSRMMCLKKSKRVTDILERFLSPFTLLYLIESGYL
jgi:hypothetical protein